MTSQTSNECSSQQRILRVLMALAGNEFHGLAPSEIAKGLQILPSTVTRDIQNLLAAGFAEKIEDTGRWRLGPKLVQVALAFSTELQRARSQVDGITNRYTREP